MTGARRLGASLSVQNRQRLIAEAAGRTIADVSRQNGQEPAAVIVDGRPGAPLASVDPDRGVIIARFTSLGAVLAWIQEQLVIHSPVRSGRYAASHTWLADGALIDVEHPPRDAAVFIVLNTVPYARKIEQGTMTMRLPGHVYDAVAVMAQRRFAEVASIGFQYMTVPSVVPQDEEARERPTRVPAITVTARR